MTDLGYIVAGYGVILGGMAAYAWFLLRRLAAARRAVLEPRDPIASGTDPAGTTSVDDAP